MATVNVTPPLPSSNGRATPSPLVVYVHFPWCLEKCPYCDFVSFATRRDAIDHEGYADAVVAELAARTLALSELGPLPPLESIFFGGGTPSLWAPSALARVIDAALSNFGARNDQVEITAECNPSSLPPSAALALARAGVNRLSVGVQSLDHARLRSLGRLHTGDGALDALRGALAVPGVRVSGDLLYGVPGQPPSVAADEVGRIADEGVTHVSAYNLTIEPNTRFGELARRGRLPLADEGDMVASFFAVHDALAARGFEHYEISNYAREGDRSRHNLGYWRGLDYLGLGCAAVGAVPTAFGHVRYRNQPDPARYLDAARDPGRDTLLAEGPLVSSIEALDPDTRLKERIMLGLRLAEGLDLAAAADDVGARAWTPERERAADKLARRGRLVREGDRLRVPLDAWVFCDGTAAELF